MTMQLQRVARCDECGREEIAGSHMGETMRIPDGWLSVNATVGAIRGTGKLQWDFCCAEHLLRWIEIRTRPPAPPAPIEQPKKGRR